MKKERFWLLAVPIWGLLLWQSYGVRVDHELFPEPGKGLKGGQVYVYDDQSEGGLSTNLLEQDSVSLVYRWTLDGGTAYPYVGGGISWLRAGKPCVDLSGMDSLQIRWRLKGAQVARIAMHNFDSARSDRKDPQSLRILMVVVPLSSEWQHSHLALADWSTPPWWFSQHRVAPNKAERFQEQVCELEWDVPGAAGVNSQGVLEIASIHGTGPDRTWFWICLGFGVAGIFARFRLRKRLKGVIQETLTMGVPVSPAQPGDWLRLEAYLKENYRNPEISAEFLCHHFGWNSTKFTAIVKEGCGMNFKQALNRIRIAAACQLLKGSAEPVSRISDAVGFSNVTHFNRVFKELQGASPTEYRAPLIRSSV